MGYDFFKNFIYPTAFASICAVGVSFCMDRILLLSLVALGVLLYQFRWLLRVQKPVDKSPMWGYVTIPQGETWNISMTNGQLNTVNGPRMVCVWGATLLRLPQLSALSSQYLLIEFVDGQSEIVPGPAQVHMDKIIHKDVKTKDAINLTDSEVLIVYRENQDAGSVSRHVIRGPCLHVPKNATEWTHQFSWHGSVCHDVDSSGRKVKGAMKFTKLRVSPDQTYFDVEGVRTRDDALLSVKIMIFFRLQDIDVMLKETHDPIADFINSVSSDVIEFVAGKTFEDFKAATDQLNNLSVYRNLTSRAKGIGFEVTKVVFRGYGAPQRLQKMHDDAIERRTKLTLDRENEEQEQKLQDMKLEHEEARLQKRRQMETDTKAHELKLQRSSHEAQQQERKDDRQSQIQHLDNMRHALGLSGDQLAAYLVAMEQGPPGKLVQIIGKEGCVSDRNSFVIQDAA
jgi:hypothetical protein